MEQNPLKCVVHYSIFKKVDSLLRGTGIKKYDFESLTQTVESVVLYDQVLLYDYNISFLGLPFFDPCDRVEPISTLKEREQDVIQEVDASDIDAEWSPKIDFRHEWIPLPYVIKTSGYIDGGTKVPPIYLDKIASRLDSIGIETAKDYLSQSAFKGRPPVEWSASDFQEFCRRLTANRLWHIEVARTYRDQMSASGVLYPPWLSTFLRADHKQQWSCLHQRFHDFEESLLDRHTPQGVFLDLSPLTLVLLDTSPSRERIPETLWQMRRDYSELRDIARRYDDHLQNAESMSEVSELTQQWAKAWEAVLKRIKKPKKPLLRELFGWDLLAKPSVKNVLGKSARIVGERLHEKAIVTGLNILYEFQEEFLFSRQWRQRVGELFPEM
ncbi:hypothetical protein ACFLU6_05405 [Acidobacteriota bacterium]